MRSNGNGVVPDFLAQSIQKQTAEMLLAFQKARGQDYTTSITKYRRNLEKGERILASDIADQIITKEAPDRDRLGRDLLIQACHGVASKQISMQKAGVTSSLGYNFYDLRGPAYLIYPVVTPFRNAMPRMGRVNAGVGTAANWKATRNPGTPYIGVPEGQRSQVATPDENNFFASYKELGDERAVTFTAEFAGEGYTDNLADEHLRGLHALWLQEEAMMLFGNSGTASGNNGFALGTAPTPVGAAPAANAASTLPSGTSVSACLVLLTAMGFPATSQYGYLGGSKPTPTTGLTPNFSYNAPGTGTQITINGGTSAVSAMSAVELTTAAAQSVTFAITPSAATAGTFGYAWYVNTTDASAPTKANAHLYAITQFPSVTVTSLATAGNQAASATGLNTDNSFEPYDFDGLFTYTRNYGIWQDLLGQSLTSNVGGVVPEVENILETLYLNYQLGVDAIWGSPDAIKSFSQAILANGSASTGYLLSIDGTKSNGVIGGVIATGYNSRYAANNPSGAGIIPLKMHPMIPPGTLYFDIATNPYPSSRIPTVRGMLLQRDYYGIEWPLVSRAWTFGTYVHEVLAHYIPWATAVLTGIGPYVPA